MNRLRAAHAVRESGPRTVGEIRRPVRGFFMCRAVSSGLPVQRALTLPVTMRATWIFLFARPLFSRSRLL